MSEPLKVISLQRPHLSADRVRWCEKTVVVPHVGRGWYAWYAWFVWEGGYYLAMTPAAGAESEVGDAPAGAVAYAKTLLELAK